MAKSFPAKAEDITAAWLAETVGPSALHPAGLRADGVSNLLVTVIGDELGFTSHVFRVCYDADGVATRIIVKVANGVSQSLAAGYETEVLYYQSRLAMGTDGQLYRSPTVYVADRSADSQAFLLVLEDMAAPYAAADQLGGLDYRAAEAAVLALAGMHAQYWHCHPDHKDKPRPHGEQGVDGLARARSLMALCGTFPVVAMWSAAREYVIAESVGVPSCGDWAEVPPETVLEVMDRISGQFARVAGEHWAGDRVTLVHGDYRGDNIMTAHASASELPSCPVDYQAVHFGRPMVDLGYFMSSSLTVPMRRKNQEALLRVYHQRLLELGVKEEWLPWEECVEGFRRDLLFSALMPVMMAMRLGQARSQQAERPGLTGRRLAMNKVWLERGVAALIDNDTAGRVDAAWPP